MRPLGTRIIFEVVLGLVLITSLRMTLRQSRRIAEYQRYQEADAQSLRLLQEALRQKDLQMSLPLESEEIPGSNDHAGITRREAAITRLDGIGWLRFSGEAWDQ